MSSKIQAITQKVKDAVLNYPLVLATSLLMAFSICFIIENDWNLNKNFLPMRLIITSALGISFMFSIKMFSQRIGREWLWQTLGLAILVGYFFILPKSEREFTEDFMFLIIPSFVLSHLLVACVAFIGKEPEMKFWQYNKNLFINIFLTAVFTGVLTGGVLLAILAVEQLFGIRIQEETYGETFTMLSVFGSTCIFLLFNEKGLSYLEQDGSYPAILKFFTQFILIPLLLIYVVIMYMYAGKIIIKWQLPQGWVSYLILAYSIVGILALLLVHPLKENQAKSWVKMFSRVFYFSLLPLIVLLFVAIFTRVLQYGFTEARYYVLLLAIWLLMVVVYFIINRNSNIKFIPISLFILGLLSLITPYFNTFSVAKRSQKNELEQILAKNDLLINGKINFEKKISSEVMYNVSDKFKFLSKRSEHQYLRKFMDDTSSRTFATGETWYINNLFHNITNVEKNNSDYVQLNNSMTSFKIGDYDYLIKQDELQDDGVTLYQHHFSLSKNPYGADPTFILSIDDKEELDFMPMMKELFKKYEMHQGYVKVDSLQISGKLGAYQIQVLFSDLNRSNYGNGLNYYFSDALFLIKETASSN